MFYVHMNGRKHFCILTISLKHQKESLIITKGEGRRNRHYLLFGIGIVFYVVTFSNKRVKLITLPMAIQAA